MSDRQLSAKAFQSRAQSRWGTFGVNGGRAGVQALMRLGRPGVGTIGFNTPQVNGDSYN